MRLHRVGAKAELLKGPPKCTLQSATPQKLLFWRHLAWASRPLDSAHRPRLWRVEQERLLVARSQAQMQWDEMIQARMVLRQVMGRLRPLQDKTRLRPKALLSLWEPPLNPLYEPCRLQLPI